MKYITPELLRQRGACEDAVERFEQWLDDRGWTRARPTARNLKAAYRAGLPVHWLIHRGLVPPEACLEKPRWAYLCLAALHASGFEDELRSKALEDASYAVRIAGHVDREPRDDTRRAASENSPFRAYYYAKHIDKHPHPVTWAAVEGSRYEIHYVVLLGRPT